MYKKLFTACLLLGTVLFAASCRRNILKGEGPKGTTNPTVTAFNAIDMDLPLKASITVQQGTQPGIQFNGYENIIKHLKVKVENNTLTITTDLDDTWDIETDDITVQVTMPSLTALSLSGSSDADIHGNITGSIFELSISGAGNVVIDNITTDTFSSEVAGAASIEVKAGAVKNVEYEISGAGKIKAYPLQTMETHASISGAGKAEVTALQKLDASISGAGYVKYKGHPSVTQQIAGAGAVTDAN
ncbi:MAG: hypothetical protein JWQ38_37 [Flavipsychrobacter sp.]|nr:hypothetical protein [Flavipsychrobacter sp.]